MAVTSRRRFAPTSSSFQSNCGGSPLLFAARICFRRRVAGGGVSGGVDVRVGGGGGSGGGGGDQWNRHWQWVEASGGAGGRAQLLVERRAAVEDAVEDGRLASVDHQTVGADPQ